MKLVFVKLIARGNEGPFNRNNVEFFNFMYVEVHKISLRCSIPLSWKYLLVVGRKLNCFVDYRCY